MAKPIKIWSGTEWVDVAIQSPVVSGLATTSALSAHESDTTNVHGIADTSQLATQTYVNNQVAALVDSAPSTLDTLNELAAALGDDANFSTTVTNSIADKVSKSGGDTITVSSGSTVPLTIQNNGTGNSFVVNDVASDTTPFLIDASGNIGVGTSNPAGYKFRIAGTSGVSQFRAGTNEDGYLEINAFDSNPVYVVVAGTTATAAVFGSQSNIPTIFFSNNSERLRIENNGRIKVFTGNVLEAPVVTNAQTSSYTLVLADAGKLIEMNSASAMTLTIPADASVAFPVGTKIDILQTGSGQVTIAGSGFTPNATPGLKISAQWGAASLVKRGTNSWVVIGNLSA